VRAAVLAGGAATRYGGTPKGLLAVVVSSMGDHLHVYSSDARAKLALDGQPQVDLSAEGVDLSFVTAGAHELTLSHGSEQYKLAIEVAATPAINAFVESGQNVGALVGVTSNIVGSVFDAFLCKKFLCHLAKVAGRSRVNSYLFIHTIVVITFTSLV